MMGAIVAAEKISKVNLVDLAGSERMNTTGIAGQRGVREAVNINKSLSVLGDVIKALSDRGMRAVGPSPGTPISSAASVASSTRSSNAPDFVPYRNSMLTWLLKDSLGGNSRLIMLATVSPTEKCYHESLSTLKYVERVKFIVNTPAKNIFTKESPEVQTLMKRLHSLQSRVTFLSDENAYLLAQLDATESEGAAKPGPIGGQATADVERRLKSTLKRNSRLEKEVEELKAILVATDSELESVRATYESEISQLREEVEALRLLSSGANIEENQAARANLESEMSSLRLELDVLLSIFGDSHKRSFEIFDFVLSSIASACTIEFVGVDQSFQKLCALADGAAQVFNRIRMPIGDDNINLDGLLEDLINRSAKVLSSVRTIACETFPTE
jgi:hypothetical protein